jgi:exodeoxyribonuclease V alpha subunit
VAAELADRGSVRTVGSTEEAHDALVHEYVERASRGERVAIVVATNADAQAVNGRIQQLRARGGELDPTRCVLGVGEEQMLVGDVVQTRRNDRSAGVENRATWIIRSVHANAIVLESPTNSSDLRHVTRAYAADHMHLAYATTVHGVQGETTDAAIVGPGVDAAGLYVGLTRGRHTNTAVVVAPNKNAAIADIAATMLRGTDEFTLSDSARAARDDLRRSARERMSSLGPPTPPGAWSKGLSR